MTRNKEYYFTTTTVTVYALVNLHSLNTEEWRRSVLQNKSDFFFFGAECECLFCSVFTSIILSAKNQLWISAVIEHRHGLRA